MLFHAGLGAVHIARIVSSVHDAAVARLVALAQAGARVAADPLRLDRPRLGRPP